MLYSGDAMQILANSNYTYIVMEPQQLQKLHDALVLGNTYGITPNLVLNYVYYSTVRSMSDYLPWNAAVCCLLITRETSAFRTQVDWRA